MTTIAYSAGVMAADTQVTAGNRKFRTHKVRRMADGGLIGGAGHLTNILRVQRWAEEGFSGELPELKDGEDDEGEFECLVVMGDGSAYLLDSELELMPIHDEFIALGSGGNYAMGAMACGMSPLEAVRIAARFDAATSEPVESWKVEPAKKPRKRK